MTANFTLDRWFEKHKPIKNEIYPESPFDGTLFETYGKEWVAFIKIAERRPRHAWTLVENDGIQTIIAGLRHVNRLGYFFTEIPWENWETEVCLK